MKKLLFTLVAIIGLIPTIALATPTTWDFAGGVLAPLRSMWANEVRVPYITATSTTATSTFAAGISTTRLNVTSGTSTAANGFNLTGGCYAVNGQCITAGGASLSGGTTNGLAYWTSPTTLSATFAPTISYLISTSTTASSFMGDVGIGTTSPDVPLHIGDQEIATPDATISMSRLISGTGNGHGISDETHFDSIGSYNSFDARAQILDLDTGSGGHYAAYQARPDFSTGTTVPIYRAYAASSPEINNGTILTDYYGYIFSGPTVTSGSVTNAYGSYISNIGAATNKWAYYAVADKSYFGGNVGIGTTTPASLLHLANATGDQITLSDTNTPANQKHWYIESNSGEFNVGTTSDDFSVISSVPFQIEQTGEVGINAVTPTSILEVGGTAYDTQGLFESNGTYNANASGVAGGVFESMPTINVNTAGLTLANFRTDATVNTTADVTGIYGHNNTLALSSIPNTITDVFLSNINATRGAGYTGTTTNLRGYRYTEGTNSGTGVITNQVGLNIGPLDDATNNTSILLGNTNPQAGNFGILSQVNYPNLFQASTTDSTAAPLVVGSDRVAIVSGNSLGNLQFWSNDTNYTAPGNNVASVGAVADGTHTGALSPTALTFSTASALVPTEKMRLTSTGRLGIGTTSPTSLLSVGGDSTFGGNMIATGTLSFSSTGMLQIPSGASPTVDAVGETALDTTSNQLLFATSTTAGAPGVLTHDRDTVYQFSTSTLDYYGNFGVSGTTTMDVGNYYRARELLRLYCDTDAGTTTIRVTDGTNAMSFGQCDSDGNEIGLGASNKTFTAREGVKIEVGGLVGSNNFTTITATWGITRD